MKKEWFVIINPVAGSGNAEKNWPQVESYLKKEAIRYHYKYTQATNHALELAVECLKNGYHKLLVVGGEGTFNEVINGVFVQQYVPTTEVTVGLIGLGEISNFSCINIHSCNLNETLLIIKNENTYLQDVGKVFYHSNEKKRSRYFINNARIGLEVNLLKKNLEKSAKDRSFKFNHGFNAFLNFRNLRFVVTIDDNTEEVDFYNMKISLCKHFDEKTLNSQHKDSDQEFFDIQRIEKGKLFKHSKLEQLKGKLITIEAKKEINLVADGEFLGNAPFSFEIIPKSIKVLVK